MSNCSPTVIQSYLSELVIIDVQVGERRVPQEIWIFVHLTDRIEVNPRIVFFRKNDLQPLREEGTPVEKTIEVKAMFDEP